MKSNWSLDFLYYMFTLFVIGLGFVAIYLGNRVLMQDYLINIGLWTIGIGIVLFFAKNAIYLLEDPEKGSVTKKFVA